jgi:bifunctional non-homologous end joining protein LigD
MAKRKGSAADAAAAVDEQLARYRSMRDFGLTAEPSGASEKPIKVTGKTAKTKGLPFCIQKHAASHLHYDFRLGWNGVLKSWAVAKGPSYLVKDKRLAVQVEDHPMEYGGFEGIIPAGQYGGGTVMVWDQGTWEPQAGHTDVDAGLRDGALKFVLRGAKMKGKWALVRMGGKAAGERKPNWLLIKEHDEFERGPDEPIVTEAEPNSVVTARSLEEIAADEDHVWNSKETAGSGKAWFRQKAKATARGERRPIASADEAHLHGEKTFAEIVPRAPIGHPASRRGKGLSKPYLREFMGRLKGLPEETQPEFIKPQLALEAAETPDEPGWLYELKLDGYRMQARKDGSHVKMLTRSGLDWTARMRDVADEIGRLPVEKVTLDGEVVVLASDGTTNFAGLQAAFQEGAQNPLTYFCFDALHLEGRSTRALPLVERKALLAEMLVGTDTKVLAVSEHIETGGKAMFKQACSLGAEGIIAKRAQAKYAAGSRGGEWLKLKCLYEQEFVVGGYTLPGKSGAGTHSIGALLLGYYTDSGLVYVGRTGTGFTQKMRKMLRERLETMERKTPVFGKVPRDASRGVRWVKPELVAQVRFATWTAEGQVRQAAFLGLREDKVASEVAREGSRLAPKRHASRKTFESRTGTNRASGDLRTIERNEAGGRASHQVRATGLAAKATGSKAKAAETLSVRLTHPDKVLDEESGMTKRMLAEYYWGVAERMLPYIAGRPLSLVRCPEGSSKPCFFQKHVTAMLPEGIETVEVPDKKMGKLEPYIALRTKEALAGLAQMGVLEVHPWGSRSEDLEHPDTMVLDLDPDLGPDETRAWTTLAGAAMEVRIRLKKLGLESFVKTTGGKGLHVVVPMKPQLDWATLKEFAHRLVMEMEKTKPELYLTKMTKAARAGKIYLDYLRNERGATAIAPYSPRARVGATVSMPLKWVELKLAERPVFRVAEFESWRTRLKTDPWEKMLEMRQSVTAEALTAVGVRG